MSRLAREPLVHFLLLGALLFVFFALRGGDAGATSKRIVVSAAQIDHLAAAFARTWQRPPTIGELKGLVDDYVREEIAVREATAMGLDRDDTIIRRRLRQKLEFITQDVIDAEPATREEVERWYREHLDAYTAEPEISFQQLFIDRDRRGADAESVAQRMLARLQQEPGTDPAGLGDPTMLPAAMEEASKSEVARTFGTQFAEATLDAPAGRWSGPVESGFGLHLLYVQSVAAAHPIDFERVAPIVERDYLAARSKRELDAFYARLLEGYRVELDFDVDAGKDGEQGVTPSRAGSR
jgi:hypothetical protein